ncbi:PREDICTED: putative defensin-like protein 263 [Camelina sativa]|uniref:Defensin-like protein 263 n=1 Tax=Camelina sativa TaxID=90675 RepID=A0ABM1R3W8_CAMSA|nr:PREDICTED: putative defensin-like protein 263 [Camelina sativa]
MEKMSLKLVFLFSLTVVAFCLSMGDAREMAVYCIGGKCPEAQTMDTYETNVSCRRDNECIKYCPKGCKIVNCNFGTCFCEC